MRLDVGWRGGWTSTWSLGAVWVGLGLAGAGCAEKVACRDIGCLERAVCVVSAEGDERCEDAPQTCAAVYSPEGGCALAPNPGDHSACLEDLSAFCGAEVNTTICLQHEEDGVLLADYVGITCPS